MVAEPALEIVVESKSLCFEEEHLRAVFSSSELTDPDDVFRALDHFASPCSRCWRNLTALASDESVVVDLELLSRNAERSFRQLPVALVLGRFVDLERGTGSEASIPPTNRRLLRKLRWGKRFNFWWLLVEEARLLALTSPDPLVERWSHLADTLARHPCGPPDRDRELGLLIRAYEADELRVAGHPQTARRCLDDVLAAAGHCRPTFRATFHEMMADLDRSIREPEKAIASLEIAEQLLVDVEIPGRLAETRTRIAMSLLLSGKLDRAFTVFQEALGLIPEGTDPRLRLDVLLHMAALKARQLDFSAAKRYLSEAEPFFERHGSELMYLQRCWLWGLIHLNAGNYAAAEENLLEALEGFDEFDAPLARAQVLANLSQVYLRMPKPAELDWALTQMVSTLNQPEIRLHILDEVENVLREVRESGRTIPELNDLRERREWVH